MPIYGSLIKNQSWVVEKNIKLKDLAKYIKIFKEAMETFEYSKNKVLLNSITLNLIMDEVYVAEFDVHRTIMNESDYMNQMVKLIEAANEILRKNKKINNVYFDIYGQYTCGKIIIMKKK